jgi:hypothetical protein
MKSEAVFLQFRIPSELILKFYRIDKGEVV